jgi:hypothetical protein
MHNVSVSKHERPKSRCALYIQGSGKGSQTLKKLVVINLAAACFGLIFMKSSGSSQLSTENPQALAYILQLKRKIV